MGENAFTLGSFNLSSRIRSATPTLPLPRICTCSTSNLQALASRCKRAKSARQSQSYRLCLVNATLQKENINHCRGTTFNSEQVSPYLQVRLRKSPLFALCICEPISSGISHTVRNRIVIPQNTANPFIN